MDLNLETQVECDIAENGTAEGIQTPAGAWEGHENNTITFDTEENVNTAPKPTTRANANSVQTINPADYSFQFAPEVTPIKGTFDVSCIALKLLDNPGMDVNRVKRMGTSVANTYSKLSNNLVKLNITAERVSVNFKRSANNLPKAEAAAKKVVNSKKLKGKYDFYLIVNNHAKARSNAGGDTAHLLNTLTLTGNHELGHLAPFRLEHSSVIANGKVQSSKDIYSFMSTYGSGLTSAQLRNCGWLPKQVAQYDVGMPKVEVPMEYLNTEKTTNGFVKALRITAPSSKDLYVSIVKSGSKNVFALHQSYGVNNNDGSSKSDGGGGSLRVGLFGNQFKFRDLIFTKVVADGNQAVLRVETNPTPQMSIKK